MMELRKLSTTADVQVYVFVKPNTSNKMICVLIDFEDNIKRVMNYAISLARELATPFAKHVPHFISIEIR